MTRSPNFLDLPASSKCLGSANPLLEVAAYASDSDALIPNGSCGFVLPKSSVCCPAPVPNVTAFSKVLA